VRVSRKRSFQGSDTFRARGRLARIGTIAGAVFRMVIGSLSLLFEEVAETSARGRAVSARRPCLSRLRTRRRRKRRTFFLYPPGSEQRCALPRVRVFPTLRPSKSRCRCETPPRHHDRIRTGIPPGAVQILLRLADPTESVHVQGVKPVGFRLHPIAPPGRFVTVIAELSLVEAPTIDPIASTRVWRPRLRQPHRSKNAPASIALGQSPPTRDGICVWVALEIVEFRTTIRMVRYVGAQ